MNPNSPALRADDVRAFEALMRRHNRLLFRTARSILRDDAESEEAVQDAYFKAWRALPGFRGEAKISTWLVRIVVNEALGRARRRSGQVLRIAPQEDAMATDEASELPESPENAAAHDPERLAMRRDVRRLVEAHIDELPEQFRTVFVLRALEELSVEEVAEALHIQPATVRTRFFRARGLLREALARDVDFAIEDAFSFEGGRCDRIVATLLQRITDSPTTENKEPS
jgi:RNA polymerase sigma-70 factor, ECF subfamily